ncbi:MAG: hypothetical protein OXG36_10995, partial [Caldilineaceae bacterium]|nr:hypothetical protein [Caldilineaceae bacterium]
MSSLLCPIWNPIRYFQEVGPFQPVCHSPRAGGFFKVMADAIPLLHQLSDQQKVNLSYWIFDYNRRCQHFGGLPDPERIPDLDVSWVETHRDQAPSSSDRLLSFLRELIRQYDAREATDWDKLLAAGGCKSDEEMNELWMHAHNQGWIHTNRTMGSRGWHLMSVDFSARMHIDTQERTEGQGRQGFVAMWFDTSMEEAYDQGFMPAIEAAGYEPYRVDREHFLGKVDDRIIDAIRQSRFVVADFTCGSDGARGGVYFEAGFAHGLGIQVV